MWEHVFVNTDESQMVGGLGDLYITVQVQLTIDHEDYTLHIQVVCLNNQISKQQLISTVTFYILYAFYLYSIYRELQRVKIW